ncbi:DUF637 domain-containing protein [Aeromonas sp. FDAARGOS 1419]|uniref:DUF637 domain-containing protein n=1 Tax=Aeromonas sp. FDAARGOS 1419 TaxID=2778068 RepID=UPI001C23997E|nr:DUF637 domain-containing protein [Aeromonas sp. FDAARGOS 1419]QWZ79220.1 DUF637 domain-containing protein [Aeromonas sp. FDAARGOS 1419]
MSWDTFNRVTGHATISAGINSTINGGSFGDAFKGSLLANIQGDMGHVCLWIGLTKTGNGDLPIEQVTRT